mgnify:CR=1 FL=1
MTGRGDLKRADAQYTRYSAGQYLTRHSDDIYGQSRRIAYVFGFTRAWHPDYWMETQHAMHKSDRARQGKNCAVLA